MLQVDNKRLYWLYLIVLIIHIKTNELISFKIKLCHLYIYQLVIRNKTTFYNYPWLSIFTYLGISLFFSNKLTPDNPLMYKIYDSQRQTIIPSPGK